MLKQGFYNTLAGVIRLGLGILTVPVLIRLMGVESYGLWALASAVVALVGLAEAGLATATTVFVSQDLGREDCDGLAQTLTVTVSAMLALAMLAVLALWGGAEWIVTGFPKLVWAQQREVVQALQISGVVVWARLIQQVCVGVEQAYQRYGWLNALNTVQAIVLSGGMLWVAGAGGRIVALMQWQAAIGVAGLLGHVYLTRSLLKNLELRPQWNREKGIAVGQYSLMVWISSLGGALFSRCDRLIVGNILGPVVLGVYAAITDMTMQINSFSALPVQPLLPKLSALTMAQTTAPGGERSPLKQHLKQALQINGVVALGLGATFMTLSPFILNILFDSTTAAQYAVPFRVATCAYALYSMNAVGYYLLLSTHAVKTCAWTQFSVGMLSILIIAIGSHFFGLTGAMVGNFGYILIFSQTIIGMKKISIPNSEWLRWLYFPAAWFCLTLILAESFIGSASKTLLILLFMGQNLVILLWFLSQNQHLSSKLTSYRI